AASLFDLRCSPYNTIKQLRSFVMLQGNTNTNKRIPLAAFMKWPLAKRQDFIDREMSGCPDFIKTSLLRH
ncbi:TPA: hypothetical protein ACWQLU_004986, partial [Salmonella enterica]